MFVITLRGPLLCGPGPVILRARRERPASAQISEIQPCAAGAVVVSP